MKQGNVFRRLMMEDLRHDIAMFELTGKRPSTLVWHKGNSDDDGQVVEEDCYLTWEDYISYAYGLELEGGVT